MWSINCLLDPGEHVDTLNLHLSWRQLLTAQVLVSSGSTSSMVLQYHSFLIALFKFLEPRHSLKLSSGFFKGTMEFIYSVCPCTSVM